MEQTAIIAQLKEYFAQEVLQGKDVGLNETTPLLEWGIINSFEMIRLINFINKQFNVDIPPGQMIADHFINILTITDLISSQASNEVV